jgi:hypothetical protein
MASSGNDDPRCPECDGPITVSSTYCMHCGADLDGEGTTGNVDDSADVSDADDVPRGSDGQDAAAGGTDADGGDTAVGGIGTGRRGPTAGGAGAGGAAEASRVDGWADTFRRHLGPDGVIDNSLTIVLGLVGGIVIGIGTLMLVGIATQSAWSVGVALLVWLTSTAILSRQRTVLGALRLGCYAVATLLVMVPVAAFSPVVGIEGGLSSRAVMFLIGEVVLVVPVLLLVVVGFVAGRARPDEVRETAE